MESDEIQVKSDEFLEVSMLMNSSTGDVSHLALDIGGSLIKMVYFSSSSSTIEDQKRPKGNSGASNSSKDRHLLNGRLQFMKFETSNINKCIEFISSMQLHCNGFQQHEALLRAKNVIKATGGGAFKFADLFSEKLGITLAKVDEMESLVAGANFLLKAVNSEAFTFKDGQRHYMQIDDKDLYSSLLVNIGSGVSMIKVEGPGKFERVSGTSIGGGTFWGLGKLLTKCKSFDELLELSHRGNNREIDMLVGDIYGGMNYSKIGLSSTVIASSFGKPVSDNKELEEYRSEDVARSLLRMISNNIGQIAYLNALRFGLKKIFFGGFFIRGHDYTMDTISVAVDYWSGGDSKAMFLRHEGFLGALGAFMSYQNNGLDDLITHQPAKEPGNAHSKGENIHGPIVGDVKENGRTDFQAIASSFGNSISENKELEDYRNEDAAKSLLRMASSNIGQIAYLTAQVLGLMKILWGDFSYRDMIIPWMRCNICGS